jgi:hypothetical protein
MRQLIALFFLAILAIGFVPSGAFAEEDVGTTDDGSGDDDNENTGDDTEREIEDFEEGLGAQMRLLQLERALTRASLHADQVIAALDNQSANTTGLKGIAAELDIMIAQVRETREDVAGGAVTNEEAAAVFVAIKKDARDLVKEFRDAARPVIRDADRERLKASLERIDRERLKAITDDIEKARRELIADRVRESFQNAGIPVDEELLERIRSGEDSAREIRREVRERVKDELEGKSAEERREAAAKLREEAARRRVQALAALDRVEDDLGDREERLRERIRIADEKGDDRLREKLEWRVEKFDEQGRRIGEVRERIEKRDYETRTEIRKRENGIETRERTRIEEGKVETRTEVKDTASDDDDDDGSGSDSESDKNDDSDEEKR